MEAWNHPFIFPKLVACLKPPIPVTFPTCHQAVDFIYCVTGVHQYQVTERLHNNNVPTTNAVKSDTTKHIEIIFIDL